MTETDEGHSPTPPPWSMIQQDDTVSPSPVVVDEDDEWLFIHKVSPIEDSPCKADSVLG